jgi:hypothetical protein
MINILFVKYLYNKLSFDLSIHIPLIVAVKVVSFYSINE